MNYCLGPCRHKGKMIFAMVTDLTRGALCPPHLNPPPRRGEGRVGVMRLEIFIQRLGKLISKKNPFQLFRKLIRLVIFPQDEGV
jgi:hypothetical protein